jgi:hypothetical protein
VGGVHRHAAGPQPGVSLGRRLTLVLTLGLALAAVVAIAVGVSMALRSSTGTAARNPADLSGSSRTRYYVSCRGGSDAHAGTSPASAWASLARASQARLRPGNDLLLAAGCTFNGTLRASWFGTASARITIGPFGTGPAPVIHQSTQGSADISVSGSYLTISGLDLTATAPSRLASCDQAGNGWIVGVDFRPGATYDILARSRLSGFYAGAFLEPGAADNLVTQSVFADNNMMWPNNKSSSAGAFGVLVSGRNNTISHNQIDGSQQCSLAYGADGSGVEVYGGHSNLIEYNSASDDHVFTELGLAGTSGNVYAFNLFDTSAPGQGFLTTRGSGNSDGPVTSTILYNNTAYETGRGDAGVVCFAGCNAGLLTMQNNIIDVAGQALYADGPFQGSNNLFWGIGHAPLIKATATGASTLEQDPGFTDAARGAFDLRPGSPATGAGIPLPASLDLSTYLGGGPVTSPPSIGAYGA